MALELNDGKITGSSGVAKAGLALGIVGTALSALNTGWGNGVLGFGNNAAGYGMNGNAGGYYGYNNVTNELSQYKAEKYTDIKNFDMYERLVALNESQNEKIANLQAQISAAYNDLDKRTALNEQAQILNREYDSTVRDYMMTIVNNKIDCCCDKMNITNAYERELSELADASILSYVNSTFIPGKLSLPASSITPAVVLK